MKFQEFINTNANEISMFYFYFGDEPWDEMEPEIEVADLRDIDTKDRKKVFSSYIDQWFVDANFALHVLLSE